jgi:uncharacterized protein YecT (DUF1311 family)
MLHALYTIGAKSMRPYRPLQPSQIIFVDRVICLVVCHVISLLVPLTAQAQSKAEIDAALSTRSFRQADAALNMAYARDMAGKNVYIPLLARKRALQKAQLAWLKFRDAEAAFIASGYVHTTTHTGGHWVKVYTDALTALTDERTRYLKAGSYNYNYNYTDTEDDSDKTLNEAYKALLSVLDDRQKKLLTTAELAWIKFRDAEMSRFDGTKPKYADYALYQLTVDRTGALKASYSRYKQLNSSN